MLHDFSERGLFINHKEGVPTPPVGSVIEVQSLAFGETAPVLKARVVRVTEQGMGVVFIDDAAQGGPQKG